MLARRCLGALTLFFFVLNVPAAGWVTFFPATPYLSAADSPFDLSGLGTTFFLEDFEDGVWDLPPGVSSAYFDVDGPGITTDSVDADDGIIDGWGNAGHSLVPLFKEFTFSIPPIISTRLLIRFDRDLLGFSPNAFGMVWTDGLPGSRLLLSVVDIDGNRLADQSYFAEMPDDDLGETQQDRFVGFTSDVPFRSVTIVNMYRGSAYRDRFEIDHVQFGVVVPEPIDGSMVIVFILLLVGVARLGRTGDSGNSEKEVCGERAKSASVKQSALGGGCALSRSSLGVC